MNAVYIPPTVRAETPAPTVTERYVHVNSMEVIDLMKSEGFEVASIQLPGKRSKARDPMYVRHQIDFRHADWINNPRADRRGGYVPRMLFTNAHDGSASATYMMGVYAFICSNGMVIGSTYAQERVKHIGTQASQLIERMRAMAKNTAPLFAQIDEWSGKQLSVARAREFARLASVLRWGDPHRFDVEDLLQVRRPEDDAGDLWTVFNRVQENTVRGGFQGLSRTGRATTSRPLSEITANNEFNRQLWTLAEEFAA